MSEIESDDQLASAWANARLYLDSRSVGPLIGTLLKIQRYHKALSIKNLASTPKDSPIPNLM